MATILRPKDEKPRKRNRRQESGSGNQDPGDSVILGPCSGSRADPNGGVKMRDFWQLRQELANALNRIDELEAQVLILARGGKEKETQILAPKDEILFSMYKDIMNLSAAARKILFVKAHLMIAYNSERRQLLLAACPEAGKGTVRVPKSANYGINNKTLGELLTRECRYDLSVVRIYLRGTVCRSRAGAIIFDLSTLTTKKAGRMAKS